MHAYSITNRRKAGFASEQKSTFYLQFSWQMGVCYPTIVLRTKIICFSFIIPLLSHLTVRARCPADMENGDL